VNGSYPASFFVLGATQTFPFRYFYCVPPQLALCSPYWQFSQRELLLEKPPISTVLTERA
jgi:hypothetical protein